MTDGQKRALDALFPHYRLPFSDNFLDFKTVFGDETPVILEIGFGNGETLLKAALHHPDHHFLGIEVHRPGVGALLLRLEKQDVQNVRVICQDAIPVLESMIPKGSLEEIWIFFPDPWPKKRHHKRRLVQPAFVNLLAEKLKTDGTLRIATDFAPYAEQMMLVLENTESLLNVAGKNKFADRFSLRPLTRFEQRGKQLGHDVFDLAFTFKKREA